MQSTWAYKLVAVLYTGIGGKKKKEWKNSSWRTKPIQNIQNIQTISRIYSSCWKNFSLYQILITYFLYLTLIMHRKIRRDIDMYNELKYISKCGALSARFPVFLLISTKTMIFRLESVGTVRSFISSPTSVNISFWIRDGTPVGKSSTQKQNFSQCSEHNVLDKSVLLTLVKKSKFFGRKMKIWQVCGFQA